MPRESGIEKYGCDLIKGMGWWQFKVGHDGWPDRIVIFAPKRHFWWEVKQPDGSFTPAQKVRIPRMKESGEAVFAFDSREEIRMFLEMLR